MPTKTLDLMEILEEYSPTMMSNGQIRCECPFRENHADGSGMMSMFLSPSINAYHCFSCHEKGNLVGLLTKRFKVGYFSAIELVQFNEYERKKEEFELDILWSINEFPKEFIKRGYNEDTLRHFGVGMSDDGSMVIPYYRNFDRKTELLGYQKRWYEPSRKVRNSTGFDKQNYLYNYDPKNTELYVVEGQSDVWRLYQYGYKNAVALMGVELSEYQMSCLSLCDTIYLALDNDEAGRIATEKIYDKMKNHCNIMLIPYPSKDVGECSKDDWDDAVTRMTDYLTYTMEMSIYSDSYASIKESAFHKKKVKAEQKSLEDIDYSELLGK